MDIEFDTACVFFDCARCKGSGIERIGRDPDYCSVCGGSGDHPLYIGTLLANLAVAGALCAAFRIGALAESFAALDMGAHWAPNVAGVHAPGWSRTAPGDEGGE